MISIIRLIDDLPVGLLEWLKSLEFDNVIYVSSFSPDEVGSTGNWVEILIDIDNWWYVCGELICPYKPGQNNYEGAILRFGLAGIDLWLVPGRRAWACL